MRERIMTYAAVALAIVAATTAPAGRAQARSAPSGVFYHDQSGTALNGAAAESARRLASARLAFTVGLPTRWPAGTALRALWVMDHHTPRFAVLYYGDDGGYIACQLHESLTGAHCLTKLGGAEADYRRRGTGNPVAVEHRRRESRE